MQQKDFGAKAIVFSQFVNMLDVSALVHLHAVRLIHDSYCICFCFLNYIILVAN